MIPDQDNNTNVPIGRVGTDFSQIKVGLKTLDDATINLGDFKKANSRLADKAVVLKAINNQDLASLRDISDFFYRSSGIYNRLCRYMAYLYRYDWVVTPYINEGIGVAADADVTLNSNNRDKILKNFFKALKFLDEFEAKKFFGDVALKVMRRGCYYGYIVAENGKVSVQELPPQYCRSRYSVNGRPAVEFDMRFFDVLYTDTAQRTKVLNLFPPEFKKGYKAFKEGRIKPDFPGDSGSWYLLNVKSVVKFNFNGDDFPPFISVIPGIIDLDGAQDLDRQRMAQKLSRAIGIDVLTTFADVDVADMSDKSNTTQTDDLSRVERSVYNEAGVSQMQFNSNSNTALNNSILNDEATLYNLIQQFEGFLNLLLEPYNKNEKKCYYKAQILTTTIYNYKEMAKLYKEQAQMGYSKMLPQIALGQSQSSILATAYFENDVLDLVSVFVPPLTSNTMNAEALAQRNGNKNNKTSSSGEVGRPEKEDNEKSDKTLANRESM